ncbi:MAG: thioredoxin-disulfide reductase [Desulfobulbaceae bacterium]|nr:MAG: thioredoxin-disulfide reductase [Desulfobulbaceae bacterium]
MTSTQEVYDLIIIGGGPGGLTAGIYAKRAALNTVLIDKGLPGGQMNNTAIIENWPGTASITGAELSVAMAQHATSYGLEIKQREVTAIEPGLDHHLVRLDDGEKMRALSLILSAGGSPRKLGVPGEHENYGKGVSFCAVCDGFFFRNKTVVVVGGGDTALEESLYLAKIATKVYLLHRRDRFRGGMILQKRVQAQEKIEILLNTVVRAIKSDDSGVRGVATENLASGEKSELACDGVFVFIGFKPDSSLVPAGTKMNADGYVTTDDKCETCISGIFAVGDLRAKHVKQIITAAADGCTAAQAAARYVESRRGGVAQFEFEFEKGGLVF